jgi:integrase
MRLTDAMIAKLAPRPKRYTVRDDGMPGLYVRVTPNGTRTFTVVTTSPAGKQTWVAIGPAPVLTLDEARERGRLAIKRIRDGLTAVEAPPETFEQVAARWVEREVEGRGFRSGKELKRMLARCVLPHIGEKVFTSVRRSDVAMLLDHIEDRHGSRQADIVLMIIRRITNWFAARADDYSPPVVRGMRRDKPPTRERVLGDDELRALWGATEGPGTFNAIVRVCLLTAARSRLVSHMRWDDISETGIWTPPKEPRAKPNATLRLPPVALDIITAQPRFVGNDHVFAAQRGAGPFDSFGRGKRALDERMPPMPGWTVHDLRRTARSLLSRAGVRPDIAERVLGHRVGSSVAQIYDRHAYRDEVAEALVRLAGLIESIVNPPSANVVAFGR